MVYLTAENINKSLGEKVICNDVCLYIHKGDKVGLVAKNGSGKSTLLKMLVGLEKTDSGKIFLSKSIKTGFLLQDPEFDNNHTAIDSILDSSSDLVLAVKAYEHAMLHPEQTEEFQNAFDLMEKYNGWAYEAKIKEILELLKIDLEQKVQVMSGGQKKRLALAKILIDEPQFLILDEPTNHLDLEMIEWLEKYFIEQNITLLMVTHDRYFLDRVCNRLIELSHGNLYEYKGNYEYYLDKKAEREEIEASNYEKTKLALKKEYEWVSRMPQGRGTKSRGRTDAYYETLEQNKSKRSFLTEANKRLEINVKESVVGSKILSLHNVSKSFDDKKILNNFNFEFRHGERVGIVGKNGVGKSTFLNLIMGLENYDSGNIVTGRTIVFGYYSQKGIHLDEDKTVIDLVKSLAEIVTISNGKKLTASQILERFMFPRKVQRTLVSNLSGGERRRLYLLTLLLQNPNFLILDEPTNDLDLPTLEVLEEFLSNFKGCLIIVSHDRYFMDKLVDHIFIFEGEGNVRDFVGNYTDYRNRAKSEEKTAKYVNKVVALNEDENKKLLSRVEKDIKKLEEEKDKLSEKLNKSDIAYDKILEISKKVEEINKQIDEKTNEWMGLLG